MRRLLRFPSVARNDGNVMPLSNLILVTGATGYVGGRLVPRLLDAGYRVRCLVRDPNRLHGRSWLKRVEVVMGDALVPGTLPESMKDISAAYYLIHGKQGGQMSAHRDLEVARNFADAAQKANLERILYLENWSILPRIFRRTCVPVTRRGISCVRVAYRSRSSAPV
jgi:nucleoside-diphosphate-sugar epimerase